MSRPQLVVKVVAVQARCKRQSEEAKKEGRRRGHRMWKLEQFEA
jgi:hypothetical protein